MSDDLVKRLRNTGSMSHVEVWETFEEAADRIEELEAKLAKAVEALEFYRSAINLRIDCEITYAMQEAHDNAETFLAELKGETDD